MPVSFSIEKPVKKQPTANIPGGIPVNTVMVKGPDGKYYPQISTVKFSTEKPVAAPEGGVKETAVNVTKAVGRGFTTMVQGIGRALQWAAEEGTTPEGVTDYKRLLGKETARLFPVGAPAGQKAGEYAGALVDKLRPEWHKNVDLWVRNATKKVGKNVVDYYQKSVEGDILAPTPAFRQAQNMGWTTLPLEKALVSTAESAPSYVSAVAAGLILKNPHVPLALLGGLQATQTYGTLRDQNIDQEVASTAAFMSGAWEAATEKLPFDELLKGTAKPALKRFVKVGSMESFQELLAQLGGNYINFAAKEYKPGDLKSVLPAIKISWGELANGWFEAMSAGFLMGGTAGMLVKPAPKVGPTVEAAAAQQVTPQLAQQVVPQVEATQTEAPKPEQISIDLNSLMTTVSPWEVTDPSSELPVGLRSQYEIIMRLPDLSPLQSLWLDLSLHESFMSHNPQHRWVEGLRKNSEEKRPLLDALRGGKKLSRSQVAEIIKMLKGSRATHEAFIEGKYRTTGETGGLEWHKAWVEKYNQLIDHVGKHMALPKTTAPVTETTPENVTKPLQINITAEETTPIQATDISDIKDLQEQVDAAPMTGKQRLLLKNYIGDIETKVVKEIVDKYPEPITDQASLERVGNKIAKDLGVPGTIEWVWDTTKTEGPMGVQRDLDKTSGKYRITVMGVHRTHVKRGQNELKDTVVHELGHIAKPPFTKMYTDISQIPKRVKFVKVANNRWDARDGNKIINLYGTTLEHAQRSYLGWMHAGSKYQIHHSDFKKWLAENLKSVLPQEISKRIPLLNDVTVLPESDESVKPIISPSEKSEKRTGAKPRPVKPANPATNDQKMRINILAKNLGLTSEQRHALQEQLTGKKSLRAMTADEAKLVDQHLTKLSTEKGLITATAQELTARLREANLMPDEKPEVKGRREKGLRKIITTINETAHNFMDRIWHIDRLIEQLDGMEKGPLYNTIWRKVRDGMNAAADSKHDRIQEFKNAGEAIFGDADTFSQFLTAPEQDLGGGVKLTPAERVGVYVYSKNKDSLRHLLGGNFAAFEDPQLALVRVLETVTPQERAFGEWILQDMAENFDRVNQASILSLGRELTEQDNYFSMYLSEVELEQQDDFLSALLDLQRQPGVVSEPGETVSRKRGAKQPIRLDAVANYLHHVDRLEQFVHMGPIARQVGGILNNREFKRTLNIITHNTGSSILNKWLKDSTLGYSAEGTSWMARQILFFRQAGVQYAMGWKIPSMFRQFLSLPTAAAVHPCVGARVGVHLAGSAKPSYYRRLQDTAFSKSSMMRHRSMERISDYINTRMTPAQRMQYRRNWSSEAMAWMQWADRHTAVIAWNGLYDAALHSPAVIKQFGLDGSEKAAIEFADDWVGRTQSMGNVTYLSDFFRGGVVEKLLTTFQNEDNTKWNFWAHDIIQAKRAGQIDKKMVAYRLLLSYIIPALIYGIIGRGRLQKNWKEVLFDESVYVLGPMFLAGRMVYNSIQGFAGGASGPEEMGWVELEKAIENAIEGKPGPAAFHGVKAIGGLTGRIPSQAITTGTGAYELMTGKTKDLRRLIWTDWSLTKYGTQFNDKESSTGKPNYGPRQ